MNKDIKESTELPNRSTENKKKNGRLWIIVVILISVAMLVTISVSTALLVGEASAEKENVGIYDDATYYDDYEDYLSILKKMQVLYSAPIVLTTASEKSSTTVSGTGGGSELEGTTLEILGISSSSEDETSTTISKKSNNNITAPSVPPLYVLSMDISFLNLDGSSDSGDDNHGNNNIDKEKDPTTLLYICFTNNLSLLEESIKKETSSYPVTTHYSNHRIRCVHLPHRCHRCRGMAETTFMLPHGFIPEMFGAASLIAQVGDSNATSASAATAWHSIGNFMYAQDYQRSMYFDFLHEVGNGNDKSNNTQQRQGIDNNGNGPLVTTLGSTTEEYNITGTIIISGKVRRKFSIMSSDSSVIDTPVLHFRNLKMYPQPPALFLYYTTRRSWRRFKPDQDVFVHVPLSDQGSDFPDGSLYREGSYSVYPPPNMFDSIREGNSNIHQEATEIDNDNDNSVNSAANGENNFGFWYLWCDTFSITLAGGPLLPMQSLLSREGQQ